MNELEAIERWAAGLLAKLSPPARRQLLRELARELRRAQQARIAAQQNPDGHAYVPRKARPARERSLNPHLRDKAGRIKRATMFRKLRTARHLRIEVDDTGLAIGFDARVSRIARVHQEGQLAPVAPGGPLVQYPARVVLGLAPADRERVRERLLHYLSR
ncbi:phage virion morphogenesis protein [Burkholderia sp. Nafp2/4-1b]|uniref:phage virion morphogenesis protein n=1 Tax=Burkholderia sp. Nafp2/4-1b TaxID=2116686 RepID=UPI000EF87055|nr:phage virion morphogenesis protein [Burkholderia sp. Nafp2/4-1b]RKU01825.1 phage virion morphogenesis protein [Burkholderia sp. Nafp2/4-1b]